MEERKKMNFRISWSFSLSPLHCDLDGGTRLTINWTVEDLCCCIVKVTMLGVVGIQLKVWAVLLVATRSLVQ